MVEALAVGETSDRANQILIGRDVEGPAQRGDLGRIQPAMGSE